MNQPKSDRSSSRLAEDLLVTRPGRVILTFWWYVRTIARKLLADDVLFLASGIAFNGLLTLIPLLLLGAAALGVFLNSSEFGVQRAHDILEAMFPAQPFAISIKDSLMTMISDIILHRRTLGIFGALVLLYTATSLFDSVRSALHRIYEIPKTRGMLKSLLRHLGFVALAFLLFIGSSVSVWFVSVVEGVSVHVPALSVLTLPDFYDTFPVVTISALTIFMFYVIYRHIPDEMPPRTAAMISTITTSVLWIVSGRLFGLYLSSFSAIGRIYGPYAFILVLLIWVYYSSLVFIIGAIVGQAHHERLKMLQRKTDPGVPDKIDKPGNL
ncbi:MAG: YihY/virulence factor BrkB family protein [Ignavibacteria bacterium]|nr:YihY/virulence factor BrkB family protein [Ignavibacteria bacterium]